MKRSEHSHFIQADAGGRIQLPKELRGFRLFKLGARDGKYELIPLRVEEQVLSHVPEEFVPSIWLTGEVEDYCQKVLFQKIREHFAAQSNTPVNAVFLYGSRARKDALSQSDFDFGILCSRYPEVFKPHNTVW